LTATLNVSTPTSIPSIEKWTGTIDEQVCGANTNDTLADGAEIAALLQAARATEPMIATGSKALSIARETPCILERHECD